MVTWEERGQPKLRQASQQLFALLRTSLTISAALGSELRRKGLLAVGDEGDGT
jgi:hypothetical protein